MIEEVCPWCHGVGGQWEIVPTKPKDIQIFENCRGRHACRKPLKTTQNRASVIAVLRWSNLRPRTSMLGLSKLRLK